MRFSTRCLLLLVAAPGIILSGCLGSVDRQPPEATGSTAPSNSATGQSPLPPTPPLPTIVRESHAEAGAGSAIDALADILGSPIDGASLESKLAVRGLSVVRHFVSQIEGLGASCVSADRRQIGSSASFLVASDHASQLVSILIYSTVEDRALHWASEGPGATPVAGTICQRFVSGTADPPGEIVVRANAVLFFPMDLAYGDLPGPGTGTDQAVRELTIDALFDLP